MKLQNQVCSLEQGKRLLELGILPNSYLSYFGDETMRLMDNGKDGVSYSNWVFVSQTEPVNNQEADWRDDVCITKPLAPAFSVAEMGVMLPNGIVQKESEKPAYGIEINKCPLWDDNAHMWVIYLAGDQHYTKSNNEAEARAEMLIYLLTKGMVKPAEVNARLLNS